MVKKIHMLILMVKPFVPNIMMRTSLALTAFATNSAFDAHEVKILREFLQHVHRPAFPKGRQI